MPENSTSVGVRPNILRDMLSVIRFANVRFANCLGEILLEKFWRNLEERV